MLSKMEWNQKYLWVAHWTLETKDKDFTPTKEKIKLSNLLGVRSSYREKWNEMSYCKYFQKTIDYSYSEYENGDWHKDIDWRWD